MNSSEKDKLRSKLMGLGENSIRKNYYTELLEKTKALQKNNLKLEQEIQKRMVAEEKLNRLNEQLEVRIKERTSELQTSNKQLLESLNHLELAMDVLIAEEKNRAMSKMLMGLSHEINTPLGNAIMTTSFQATLIRDYAKSSSFPPGFWSQLLESNELIRRNLEQNKHLVDDMQTLFEDDSVEDSITFDVVSHIKKVLRTLEHSTQSHNIRVVLHTIQDVIVVNGLPSVFSRIVTHLVEDTVLHAFKGETLDPTITISLLSGEDEIQLYYKDNGIGIPASEIDKIFDPFYTMKKGKKRSGLGLFAIKQLITTQLHGQIKIDSNPNEGIQFIITIPNK
ncbi:MULTISPECIES: sensor histidine kinase [unclassified Fusibacter]|uniref:sensor histidine kinase n=1 Tax=unclassified Fusibacter TaxID=2624464 RepID=UPI001010EDD0|nr:MULTISPECIES: HAMP domain-containing sensor histidine kinase [unclassified Fusibacter]MCK8060261.1 HAMP domain-containing histidine kinase [Fusibacter sp. A2]NPE20450.1 HAMP domain-containing histidine kinase [Fusibacter sp. A1]RXV63655.1 sensor histidine kinase [Fusibacter sp. A1]